MAPGYPGFEVEVEARRECAGYAHLLPAQKGWAQIADEVLEWALGHAR